MCPLNVQATLEDFANAIASDRIETSRIEGSSTGQLQLTTVGSIICQHIG